MSLSHVSFGSWEPRGTPRCDLYRAPGDHYRHCGPSGSGKSTICNLVARFYDADRGSVSVGGHDVKEFTCESLLKNISMVFQNVYLFQDSVENNIKFGLPRCHPRAGGGRRQSCLLP